MGLPVLAFGGGEFCSQVFRRSFHLFGVDGHPGQLLQQGTAFLKAHQRSHRTDHAGDGGSQGGVLQFQAAIARTKPAPAGATMIVRALQMQGARQAAKALAAASGVASLTPTTARQARPGVIGGVRIEPLFDGAGGQQ
jgi:hypothetical protein